MKKLNVFLILILFVFNGIKGQIPPQAFNYSGVARNNMGNPIANATIGVQIGIRKTSTVGTFVYQENHFVNTDAFGLFNLIIGAGAIQTGSMATIDWGSDNYYLQVGMDINGGTNFMTMGTTQFLSVPYALHAGSVDNNDDADADPNNEIQTLSLSGNELSISNGNSVTLPVSSNYGGKTHVIISGNLTQAQFDAKLLADLGPNTQFIRISNTNQITTIDLSNITELVDLFIMNNTAVTTINLSNLTDIYGQLIIQENSALTNVNLLSLNRVESNINVNNNDQLTSLLFNNLSYVPSLFINDNLNLNLIQINSQLSAQNLSVSNNPLITNLDLSNINLSSGLNSLGQEIQLNLSGNSLTSLILPNFSSVNPGSSLGVFSVSSNNFTSTTVNSFLSFLVNLTIPINFVYLLDQTPPAPPTGQGINDKNTLINNGASVITD